MLACAPPAVPRLSHRSASYKALLSKGEMQEVMNAMNRLEDADCDVTQFLMKCQARRSRQRPPASRISWENRSKWSGEISNLTPVVGDARGAQVGMTSAPTEDKLPVCPHFPMFSVRLCSNKSSVGSSLCSLDCN